MRISSILLMLLLAGSVFATDKKGNYAIWGVGNSACIKYTTSRAANNANDFKQYLMGYLTSYNHQAEETYSITSTMTLEEVLTKLDDECESKPTTSFEQAIINLLIAQHDKRAKYPPGGFGR
jgi:hypothetical protein